MGKHLARNSTKLDALILDAATEAQETYIEMTEEWLSHGPESFLQMEVARKIFEDEFYVFPDASDRKSASRYGAKSWSPAERSTETFRSDCLE